MAFATLKIELRPIRLAFLVDPSDGEQLKKVFEINTLLWGGMYNPIIPVYDETPTNWERTPLPKFLPKPLDIINGYIDAFDPDFLVKVKNEIPDGINFYKPRVIGLKEITEKLETEFSLSFGTNMLQLWRYLHEKEYKFRRKNEAPDKFVPKPKNLDEELFIACSLGNIRWNAHIEKAYREYLSAPTISVDSNNLLGLNIYQERTPIELTSWAIKLQTRGSVSREMISLYSFFYLDLNNQQDLIDFWNLRAVGWSIIPIPNQWNNEYFLRDIKDIIEKQNLPYKHNPEMKYWTTIMKARSISEESFKSFYDSFELPPDTHMVSMQPWVPRIENRESRENDNADPYQIVSESSEINITDYNQPISFRSLSPKFAHNFEGGVGPRWANIITLETYGNANLAEVIPHDVPEVIPDMRLSERQGKFRISRYGPTFLEEYIDMFHYWTWPKAESTFFAWLKARGYTGELNDKGLLAKRILQLIDGLFNMWSFASEPMLRLLDKMAAGETIAFANMKDQCLKGVLSEEWGFSENDHLRFLIEKNVILIGATLQCTSCSRESWFSLDLINYSLKCPQCYSNFNFPSENPPKSPWSFKVGGPFSIANHADGSYSVLLALRFFSEGFISEVKVTPIPSFNIEGQNLKKSEVDFGLFWRSTAWFDKNIYTIFGECKTFNDFKSDEDIDRMREVSKCFPESIIAFCTLKKELKEEEKTAIKSLAYELRELGIKKSRNPLLILTQNELFSRFGPHMCWAKLGGKHQELAKYLKGYDKTLASLCDLTQQLYLDMEPYDEWLTKFYSNKIKVSKEI